VKSPAAYFGKTFASFGNYNFRVYWMGQLISQIGTWMQIVALPWFVLQLTNSAIAVGVVSALQFFPILLVVLYAGIVVDRIPKRRLLLVTQSISLGQALALAVLTGTGHIQLWHLYVLAVVLGFVNAFDLPARQSFVLELVGRDNLVNAAGLSSLIFNGSRMLGPAIGGLIIARWGVATCFLANACSFLAVLVSLFFLRAGEFRSVPARRAEGSVLAQLSEGMRYLLSKSDLTIAVILLSGLGAFFFSTSSIIPLIAQYSLHVQVTQFGLLVAAVGLGSLFASLGLATAGRTSQRLLITSAAAFGLIYMALAFVPWFGAAFVLLACLGGSIQSFGTSVTSIFQLGSPDHLRGRVMAVFTFLSNGIQPIGSLFAGFVTAAASIHLTIAIEASICLIAVMLALVYRARIPATLPEVRVA